MPAIDYEVRGTDDAVIRVQAAEKAIVHQIREITREAAELAYDSMSANVPESANSDSIERQPHRTIKQSLAIEEITFSPGGLGGGGFYEAQVGPIDDPPSHLGAVVGGSTNFPYTPHAMLRNNFHLLGFPGNFFMHREGQEPQREWIDDAIDLANHEVQERIHTIQIPG